MGKQVEGTPVVKVDEQQAGQKIKNLEAETKSLRKEIHETLHVSNTTINL